MSTKIKLLTSLVISNIFLLEPSYALTNIESKKIEALKLNNKEDINKFFELGSKAYEEQKFEEAIIYFKKIVEKFPGYGDAHYYIGLCQFSLGKYSLSIASFIDANKVFGSSKYDAVFGIGLSYLSLGYQDEARNYFRKVVNLSNDPDLVNDAQNWLTSIEEESLQKEKLDLLTSDINFREGITQLESQKYEKAEKAFRNSLSTKPNSSLALYYLGNTLYLLENYKEAKETFEKIVLIEPESKIAKDSSLYIKVIDEISSSLGDNAPYEFQISLGSLYDSNLSFADKKDTIISDVAGFGNILASYNINNSTQIQYSYYGNIFSGINDNTPNLDVKSKQFDLQRHLISGKHSYPFYDKLLLETEASLNWYFLGSDSFIIGGKLTPRINYYYSPNIITSLQYKFELNDYPVFKTRSNLQHNLDLSQYFYLFNNQASLRLGYAYQKVFANDKPLTQSGKLTDGNNYDLIYFFSNSLSSNQLSLDFNFNSYLNSRIRVSNNLFFNNYDKDDIYLITSTVTNIASSTTEAKVIKDITKRRNDVFYGLGITASIPVYSNITGNFSYNFLNNTSTITSDDYIGRSYIKHLLNFSLSYDF